LNAFQKEVNEMKIDVPTFNTARREFESRYGSLYELLNELTKKERRSLLRYGKLSKRVRGKIKQSNVEELLHVSFVFKQILVDVIKPCCRRETIVYGKKQNEYL